MNRFVVSISQIYEIVYVEICGKVINLKDLLKEIKLMNDHFTN